MWCYLRDCSFQMLRYTRAHARITYCAFQKHANSEFQKLTDVCSAIFAAANHLSGPLRKQNFTYTGSKSQGLWFVIGGFRSVLCVSRFVACDRNYDWRQRKTQLWRRLLNFRVRMFVKSAVTHLKIFNLTKCREVLVKYSLLSTHVGMPIWI